MKNMFMRGLVEMKKSGICAIAKNEEKYILEWISHHILAGFDSIVIYDNESDTSLSEIISKLSHDIDIKVIPWPSIEGISPQLSAYNDYVSKFSDIVDYTAFIDIDEFIFINDNSSVNEFIKKFDASSTAIAMNQLCFGSSGKEKYEKDLVMKRFNHSSPISFEENNYFKTLAKTSAIKNIPDCHWVETTYGDYVNSDNKKLEREHAHKGLANNPTHNPLILHHYILKSKEEFSIKKNRGGGVSSTLQGRLSKYDENAFSSRDAAYKTRYDIPNEHTIKVIETMKLIARKDTAKEFFSNYYDFI
ncbi:glycosyltransferase family 92 protein [Aeromonas rivipollensis]|uniref:glycosyltransferase family 92 protein n=1 Tax=Aeromonas rivipollensis TaxID=948519 RepID=UPI003987D476